MKPKRESNSAWNLWCIDMYRVLSEELIPFIYKYGASTLKSLSKRKYRSECLQTIQNTEFIEIYDFLESHVTRSQVDCRLV
jgi:hypothetical protein